MYFENAMSLMLPKDYEDIKPEIMKLKYPSESRPQVIKTSSDNEFTFTFSLLDAPLEEKDVEETVESFGAVLRNLNPAISLGEQAVESVDGRNLGWFEYTSPSFDGTLYNVMYCTPIRGKMLHGSFVCTINHKDSWKPVVLEVIRSIRQLDGE